MTELEMPRLMTKEEMLVAYENKYILCVQRDDEFFYTALVYAYGENTIEDYSELIAFGKLLNKPHTIHLAKRENLEEDLYVEEPLCILDSVNYTVATIKVDYCQEVSVKTKLENPIYDQ